MQSERLKGVQSMPAQVYICDIYIYIHNVRFVVLYSTSQTFQNDGYGLCLIENLHNRKIPLRKKSLRI